MAALALVFFTALSLNLFLNFALGLSKLVQYEKTAVLSIYYPWIILFVSTILLWVFFARIFFFIGAFLNFILVFPLSILGSMALEILFFRCLSGYTGQGENPGLFSIGSPYNSLSAAALFLTLHFALSFADAILLSLTFSAGCILVFLIIKEIQKRSFLEAIPYELKGTPILLISMGLLTLVFSAAAVLFLKIFL